MFGGAHRGMEPDVSRYDKDHLCPPPPPKMPHLLFFRVQMAPHSLTHKQRRTLISQKHKTRWSVKYARPQDRKKQSNVGFDSDTHRIRPRFCFCLLKLETGAQTHAYTLSHIADKFLYFSSRHAVKLVSSRCCTCIVAAKKCQEKRC